MPKFKISRLEQRAKHIFGITFNPNDAGFITKDGYYLSFPTDSKSAFYTERHHNRICFVYPKPPLNCENRYISDTGNIRTQITQEQAGFEIRKKPTEMQYQALETAVKNKKSIYIDYTDKDGGTIKSSHFSDFSDAKEWIDNNVEKEKKE